MNCFSVIKNKILSAKEAGRVCVLGTTKHVLCTQYFSLWGYSTELLIIFKIFANDSVSVV